MRKLLRRGIRALTGITDKTACESYGDKASLSSGPCERCVGRRVIGPVETVTE